MPNKRFSFGPWLLNAATRLHRNKLIAWSILRNEKVFDTTAVQEKNINFHQPRACVQLSRIIAEAS